MKARDNECCYRCAACNRRACHDNPNDVSPGEFDGLCVECWETEVPHDAA